MLNFKISLFRRTFSFKKKGRIRVKVHICESSLEDLLKTKCLVFVSARVVKIFETKNN